MRINTVRLRKFIGFLGALLPLIVIVLEWRVPCSISETWYTNAGTVFVIVLGGASGLLISYKGYERIDDILLTCTGISGFGICLFPCAITDVHEKVGPFMIDNQLSNIFHTVFAVIFFCLLAYNSLFLFTKGDGEFTAKKKKRNIIFRVCGIGMVASFFILLIPFAHKVFVTETVALFFFGISWLTKANVYRWLFCD